MTYKIGICFDWQKLNDFSDLYQDKSLAVGKQKTSYGMIAWEIFWQSMSTKPLSNVTLFHGDITVSYKHSNSVYCIGIASTDKNLIKEIERIFTVSPYFTQFCAQSKFVTDLEPLVECGTTDDQGILNSEGLPSTAFDHIRYAKEPIRDFLKKPVDQSSEVKEGASITMKLLLELIKVNNTRELEMVLSGNFSPSLDEQDELLKAAQQVNHHDIAVLLKNKFKRVLHLGVYPNHFGQRNKKVIIMQEPLNTTGDFYHVLAYIALSKALGYDVPELCLTYEDTEDKGTYLPSLRNMSFLEMLHLLPELKVQLKKINKLNRASSDSRRLATRQLFTKDDVLLLDQKALTMILTHQYALFDTVSANILRNLSTLNPNIPESVVKHIQNFGQSELQEIEKSKKPFVVFHIRTAACQKDGYNRTQDVDESFIIQIAQFLISNNINVLFINSSSIESPCALKDQVVLSPFSSKLQPQRFHFDVKFPSLEYLERLFLLKSTHSQLSAGVDIGKMLHLHFFIKLKALHDKLAVQNRPIRIIGNTSGTTDIVAFLGHNVLNIHNFKTTTIDANDYQGYRILMQMTFMSLVSASKDFNVLKELVQKWLDNNHIRPNVSRGDVCSLDNLVINTGGKYSLDFGALCGIFGWLDTCTNTNTQDNVSIELLFSAQTVFNLVKRRLSLPDAEPKTQAPQLSSQPYGLFAGVKSSDLKECGIPSILDTNDRQSGMVCAK